jgi:hypothetical protein
MFTTGLKKTEQNLKTNYQLVELDEMYWFIERKPHTETRENVYNQFGEAKYKYRLKPKTGEIPFSVLDFL